MLPFSTQKNQGEPALGRKNKKGHLAKECEPGHIDEECRGTLDRLPELRRLQLGSRCQGLNCAPTPALTCGSLTSRPRLETAAVDGSTSSQDEPSGGL